MAVEGFAHLDVNRPTTAAGFIRIKHSMDLANVRVGRMFRFWRPPDELGGRATCATCPPNWAKMKEGRCPGSGNKEISPSGDAKCASAHAVSELCVSRATIRATVCRECRGVERRERRRPGVDAADGICTANASERGQCRSRTSLRTSRRAGPRAAACVAASRHPWDQFTRVNS